MIAFAGLLQLFLFALWREAAHGRMPIKRLNPVCIYACPPIAMLVPLIPFM
ncbi:MAG: hypothetical protein KF859_07110 [Phycisphaeraceae bacterium]|nr:hypothetical protein [Phycisphaeraceae bacterium]